MMIGIPKEILSQERRVAAVPETVEKLVGMGFRVTVETGAGAGIYVDDTEYERAGATITADVLELYASADIVLKVKQPCMHDGVQRHEAELLRSAALSSPSFILPHPPTMPWSRY
jgi:NAD(P) transhydrogenase subunit alpha